MTLHVARVLLAECAKRRHSRVDRNFYFVLFGWAQNARRRYATTQRQLGLF